MTAAELLDASFAQWSADIESEPFRPLVCTIPACGLHSTAMTLVWHPDAGSVWEPRCRDHKDEVPS